MTRTSTLQLLLKRTSDSLIIRISDQGQGLNPDTIPDPLAPENILRGSGRGIFLIRAFMDEVNFRQLHPGTELTLIKHRTPAQTGGLKEKTTHEHESTDSPSRWHYGPLTLVAGSRSAKAA